MRCRYRAELVRSASLRKVTIAYNRRPIMFTGIAHAVASQMLIVRFWWARRPCQRKPLLPADVALLTQCQALELSDSKWRADVGTLVRTIRQTPLRRTSRLSRRRRAVTSIAWIAASAAFIWFLGPYFRLPGRSSLRVPGTPNRGHYGNHRGRCAVVRPVESRKACLPAQVLIVRAQRHGPCYCGIGPQV